MLMTQLLKMLDWFGHCTEIHLVTSKINNNNNITKKQNKTNKQKGTHFLLSDFWTETVITLKRPSWRSLNYA